MELSEIYRIAKSHRSFFEFEQEVKATLTDRPITEVSNCQVVITVVNDNILEAAFKLKPKP